MKLVKVISDDFDAVTFEEDAVMSYVRWQEFAEHTLEYLCKKQWLRMKHYNDLYMQNYFWHKWEDVDCTSPFVWQRNFNWMTIKSDAADFINKCFHTDFIRTLRFMVQYEVFAHICIYAIVNYSEVKEDYKALNGYDKYVWAMVSIKNVLNYSDNKDGKESSQEETI